MVCTCILGMGLQVCGGSRCGGSDGSRDLGASGTKKRNNKHSFFGWHQMTACGNS